MYEEDLEKAIQVAQALTIVADNLVILHERYPLLTAVIFHILRGEKVRIETQCPRGHGICKYESSQLVGGLDNYLEELRCALTMLQLEVKYEREEGGS